MAEAVKGHDFMFGHGFYGIFKQIKPVIVEGMEKYEVRFMPTRNLRILHNIKDSDLDKEFMITKLYNRDDFFPLNLNPGSESWLLFCDYDGKPTDLLKRLDQQVLAQRDFYKTQALLYKGQCIRLFHDLRMAILYPKRFETELVERIKAYKSIIGATDIYQARPQLPLSPEEVSL